MTFIIQDSSLGEIVYTEGIWVDKRTLMINGVKATALSKREFLVDDKKCVIKGNLYIGVRLFIDEKILQIVERSKWYELVLAFFPLVFLLIWGNIPSLIAIFPVVSGIIGGVLGALSGVLSICLMKRQQSPLKKVLIGLGIDIATIFVAFVWACALMGIMAILFSIA